MAQVVHEPRAGWLERGLNPDTILTPDTHIGNIGDISVISDNSNDGRVISDMGDMSDILCDSILPLAPP